MNNDQYVKMLISWMEQHRFAKININDDLNSIQKTIFNCFQLTQSNCFNHFQIQFYDNEYRKYIDLYSDTFDLFQELLKKLFSSGISQKSDERWTLKIVSKNKIDDTVDELMTDDTYNYQQENDLTRTHSLEESNLISTTQVEDISDEATTFQPIEQPKQSTNLKIEYVRTSEHPYGFGFDFELARHQRLQFESDMQRKTQSKTTVGGVRLRASQTLNQSSTDDIPYPALHFDIPTAEHLLDWSIYVYIITESDEDNIHYLHASKGIFDKETRPEDKFGAILNTNLVNPLVIQLTQDDLRDGRHELKIKICNIRNLATLRKDKLRRFPQLNKPIIYHDQSLKSEQTTSNLKFSSDKYHLGCILVYNNIARDICISNVTIAHRKRRQTKDEKSRHNVVENSRRKKVRK